MKHGEKAVPKTLEAIREGVGQGLHLGAQVYVSKDLETIVDLALGEAEPGVPLTSDHLMVWMSSTKPVAAVAWARLWEAGLADLDDPVARHVPEFGVHGKEEITIRHLLTHTGGFRMLETGWPELPWERILRRICETKREPRWIPGRKAGYHRASSWFVLGEIVQRLSGNSFSRCVREEIFEPLGMRDCWIGMPGERYSALRERVAPMWDTSGETPRRLPWSSQKWAEAPSPASNGIGPVRQLGRLYEMLLSKGEWKGRRLLSPQTVEALVARHRVGMYDHTFRHVLDWGLGLIPDNKHHGLETVPYGYGRHCSALTFGHSGYRTSTAFADRTHRLAVAVAFNGAASDAAHERRMRTALDTLYLELGLAEQS